MAESSDRDAVVAEALSWIGTAYHHAGRIKIRRDGAGRVVERGGADCATATYLIYRAALPARVPEIDLGTWSPQWNLSKQAAEAERYLMTVAGMPGVRELARAAEPQPGDFVLYRFAHAWAHGAIVIAPGWPVIVHANGTAGTVMRDRGDAGRLARAPMRFFTFW
jgi:cell wall-associated NlpC family hydrolase